MIIQIDLDNLETLNLSPTEYVLLYLIEHNMIENYPYMSDIVFKKLIEKGWLDESKKMIKTLGNKPKIEEWIELWPTFLTPQGYRVSGHYEDCKVRMKKFMQKYGYSWEIIMKATKNYLERQEKNKWNHTKKNMKFIYDTDGSVLAEECEVVLHGESTNKSNELFM